MDGEKVEAVTDFIFLGSKITVDCSCSHETKRHLLLGRKAMASLDSILKSGYITLPGPYSQNSGFSSSHLWMWELEHKEGWAQKNWCFWTVVLEKTLESPLDCEEIQPVNPKRNQPWIFIGRTDAESPIIWLPSGKIWLIVKDPDAEKTDGKRRWGQQRIRWLESITDSMDMNLNKVGR